jgi:hypothetical protein
MVSKDFTTNCINVAFRYILLPLNAVMVAWIVIMNHAFVYPTSLPTSYPLRSKGYWAFQTIYVCLCVTAMLVGLTNVFVVYSAFVRVRRRMNKLKRARPFSWCRTVPCYKIFSTVVLLFLGSYGLLASMAFHDILANHAYTHSCDGYRLMAEIYVYPGFPRTDGKNGSSIYDASSRIQFFKDGNYQYTMDLVRVWNQSLGFDGYDRDLQRKNDKGWGTFDLALRMPDSESDDEKGAKYFNTTQLMEDQLRGISNTPPGPVANIHYNLRSFEYNVTFTNTTAPGFPAIVQSGVFAPSAKDLRFPSLGYSGPQDREWRFTEHVCLPPHVSLKGSNRVEDAIHGQTAKGCRNYK